MGKRPEKRGFSLSEGRKILAKFGTSHNLAAYLRQEFPQKTITPLGHHVVKTNCLAGPLTGHIDNNPSMLINVTKGTIRCPVCQYFTTNFLQVLKDANGWSYKEALYSLRNRSDLRLMSDRLEREADQYDVHLTTMAALMWSCNHFLQKLIAPPLDGPDAKFYDGAMREAGQQTLDWLFKQRGHDPAWLFGLPYGVWPPQKLLMIYLETYLSQRANQDYEKFKNTSLKPERIEEILAYAQQLLKGHGDSAEWLYAVTFFYGHDPRTPGRFRLRRPDINDEKDGRFYDMPGFSEEETYGYFGLWAPYLNTLSKQEMRGLRVHLVEGENDAISAMERLLADSVSTECVIASGGTHNFPLDALLTNAGVDTVYLHPDSDNGGQEWLRKQLITAKEISCRVFNGWKEYHRIAPQAKDLDDVLRSDGYATVKRVIVDEPHRWYPPVDLWALEKACDDASAVPKEEIRERTRLAIRYGECILNEAQLTRYITDISKEVGLNPGVVRGGIVENGTDDRGFTSRLAAGLSRFLEVLYLVKGVRGTRVEMFHRTLKKRVQLPLNDGLGIFSELTILFNDMIDWVEEHVGIPDWLLPVGQAGQAVMIIRPELQRQIARYLPLALQTLVQGAVFKEECESLGFGFFAFPNPEVPHGVEFVCNNASVYFHITYRDDASDDLVATSLVGPRWKNYILRQGARPVNEDLLTEADFTEGNNVSIEEIREIQKTLHEAIREGWTTQDTDIDAEMLSLFCLLFNVPCFTESMPFVSITGQSNSGKSTAASIFSGGQVPELKLCGWGGSQTNYTEASIRFEFSNSLQPMCLEEFTDLQDGSPKGQIVKLVSESVRQTGYAGGAITKRGTTDGDLRSWKIKVPIIAQSINPATDTQDISRRFNVVTVLVLNKPAPQTVMYERFGGPEGIRRALRQLAIGLPKFYTKFRAAAKPIEAYLDRGEVKIDNRFLRNFHGTAPWYVLFGLDWNNLVRRVAASRYEQLATLADTTLTNQVFHMVWRVNNVKTGAGTTSSVAALLASVNERWHALNGARCGVYYIAHMHLLAIDWSAMLLPGGLLYRVDQLRLSAASYKFQLDQHALACRMGDPRVQDEALLAELKSYGVHTSRGALTVLYVKDYVDDLRLHNRDSTPADAPASHSELGEDAPGLGLKRHRTTFQ